MPHLVELFCGTKSVGRAFEAAGWRVTSVDIERKFEPTICKNVLELNPEDIVGPVDLLWASPPCTHYSMARTTAKTPRDLEGSDRLVQKVLDLAAHWGCHYFFENPWGLLRTRAVVAGIPMRVCDYCRYNSDDSHTHRARKRTCIWTNTSWIPERSLCRKDCGFCEEGRHLDYAQRISTNGRPKHSLAQLYAIPRALVDELVAWWYAGRTKLLEALQAHRWTQSKRANIVEPEFRTRIYKNNWSERKVLKPLLSNLLTKGALFDLVVSLLPPWYPQTEGVLGVTINKNVQCYPHRDGNNLGESVILFLGDFEGGWLHLEDGRVFKEKLVWHAYNGAELTHWNAEFTGTRYSVVVHRREGAYRMYRPRQQPSFSGLLQPTANRLQPSATGLLGSATHDGSVSPLADLAQAPQDGEEESADARLLVGFPVCIPETLSAGGGDVISG